MKKFHINREDGTVGLCRVTRGKCPFGTSEQHFTSEDEARKEAEKLMESRFAYNSKPPRGKLYVYVGVPGSGKSTLARKLVEETGGVELNRDDKRTELFGESYHKKSPDGKSEAAVTAILKNKMISVLRKGGVVIDSNTNTNPRFLHSLIAQAKALGADVEIILVNVPLEVAKERNAARAAAGGRGVPDHVIDSMASKIYSEDGQVKDVYFGSKTMAFVDKRTPGSQLLSNFNDKLEQSYPIVSQDVMIVDIDGTLSFNYELAKEYLEPDSGKKDWPGFFRASAEAPINEAVAELARKARAGGITVMAMTGRQDSAAEDTIRFLERANVPISRVLMAREGDFRGDYDTKTTMVESLEKDGFTIVHSVDDRPSSIKVWVDRGVMVSRVPEPHPDASGNVTMPVPNSFIGEGFCLKCGLELPMPEVIHQDCRT